MRKSSLRTTVVLAAVAFIAVTCRDGSGPGDRHLRPVSGFGTSDTIGAKQVAALMVEVRDSSGSLAPAGTVVRFTGVIGKSFQPEMLVQALTSQFFSAFAIGETDAAGRAGVIVMRGLLAGNARIEVSVPTYGWIDTVGFAVLPGQAAGVSPRPLDTAMIVGRTLTMRGGVVDRAGNARSDPVAWSAATPGITVSAAGIVSATTVGRYGISATAGGKTGTGLISVVPSGRLAATYAGPSGLRIVAMDLDGSNYKDLTAVDDGGIGPKPRWIPGTNTIVYSHFDGSLQRLRTVDQNGTVKTLISNPPATMTHQAEPSPAANAPVLYFDAYDSRCSTEAYCLHRSAIDGSGAELLGTFITTKPSWRPGASPDGSRAAFVGGDGTIRVFDYASKTVSSWSVPGQFPSWSPDGTQIAYATTSGGPLQLVNADGSNPHAINTPAGQSFSSNTISWSADAKWLLARNDFGAFHLIEISTGKLLPLAFTANYRHASLK